MFHSVELITFKGGDIIDLSQKGMKQPAKGNLTFSKSMVELFVWMLG